MISNAERFATALTTDRLTSVSIGNTEAAEQGYVLEQAVIQNGIAVNWQTEWLY